MKKEEPVWAAVLHALYEKGMTGESFDEYGYHKFLRNRAIAEEIEREPADVTRAVSEMIDKNLINDVPTGRESQGYNLTAKGFDVAHTRSLRRQQQQREKRRDQRQHEVNRAIGFLTLGLVFIGFVQATIVAIVGFEAQLLPVQLIQFGLALIVLTLGLLAVVAIGVLLWRFGMLASWNAGKWMN